LLLEVRSAPEILAALLPPLLILERAVPIRQVLPHVLGQGLIDDSPSHSGMWTTRLQHEQRNQHQHSSWHHPLTDIGVAAGHAGYHEGHGSNAVLASIEGDGLV
jgi:hypothetical protein